MDNDKQIDISISRNGFAHVDRYVNNSSIAEQVERIMQEVGMNAAKVTIETGTATYYISLN